MQAGNIIVGLSSTFALIAGIFIIYITVDVAAKPLIIITRNLTSTEYAYANASFRNPVVTLGAFGGCSQNFLGAIEKCRKGNESASALPEYTARSILRVPSKTVVRFAIASGAFTLIFSLCWTIGLITGWKSKDDTPLSYLCEYVPFFAFTTGIIPYLSIYSLAYKICHDFNMYHEFQVQIGNDNKQPNYIATLGSGFLLIWLAYGFIFHSITVFWVRAYQTAQNAAPAPAPAGDKA